MNRNRARLWIALAATCGAALPFAAAPAGAPRQRTSALPRAAGPTAESTGRRPLTLDGQLLENRVRASRSVSRSPIPSPMPPPVVQSGPSRKVDDADHGRRAASPPVTRKQSSKKAARKFRVTPSPRTYKKATADLQPGRSLGVLDITAYCWTGNRNAAGSWPQQGEVATLSRRIPFGTRIRIAGIGVFVVRDRIGHSSDVDIYMGREGCHSRAIAFGRRRLEVVVLP